MNTTRVERKKQTLSQKMAKLSLKEAPSGKRTLTPDEIEHILDFIKPNPFIPELVANSVYKNVKGHLIAQLVKVEIYPDCIPALKKSMRTMYLGSLIEPGESVGIITAQSIGESQTQANLNVFHKAGSSDKQPVVSKFTELLNATNNPKSPGYTLYFAREISLDNKLSPIAELQALKKLIGSNLVSLTLKKLEKKHTFFTVKEREIWYDGYECMYGTIENVGGACIKFYVNTDLLYTYNLTLREIAQSLRDYYVDIEVVFSPDIFGELDIFFPDSCMEIDEKLQYVTEENRAEVFMTEVAYPVLRMVNLTGVPGVEQIYFLRKEEEKSIRNPSGDSHTFGWLVETENLFEKQRTLKFMGTQEKALSSLDRFRTVLCIPGVIPEKCISNNVWDIYYTLGIEAVREYMIEQFTQIMPGINTCHISLLVDRMTFSGTIKSISRYTMRKDNGGPLNKASFEETMDNLLKAGINCEEEPIRGVSSSIICGKTARTGTGLCDIEIDVDKLIRFG